MQKHILDAEGKKIGRLATAAATILMGKNTEQFARNIAPDVKVEIINAGKADVTQRRLNAEVHPRFSGYPSGIKIPTVGYVIEKKGKKELFRLAVYGMLPRNKLRSKMMNNLTISE
jgi:large subunit ribosomal protein L13